LGFGDTDITSLGIAYMTVAHGNAREFVDWASLSAASSPKMCRGMKYVRHCRFSSPLKGKFDGGTGHGLISGPIKAKYRDG